MDNISWVRFFQQIRVRGLDDTKPIVGDDLVMLGTVGEVIPERSIVSDTAYHFTLCSGHYLSIRYRSLREIEN